MTAAPNFHLPPINEGEPAGPLVPVLPPAHQCRDEIEIRDWQGRTIARYIWSCDGAALKITDDPNPAGYHNGMYLSDWRGVAEDLLTYVIPRPAGKVNAMASYAIGLGPDKHYYQVQLGPVLHAGNLAGLVGALPEDMREVLSQYATLAY